MSKRICCAGGPAAGPTRIILVSLYPWFELLGPRDLSALRVRDTGKTMGNLRFLAENEVAITTRFLQTLRDTPCVTDYFANEDLTTIDFTNTARALKTSNARFREYAERSEAKGGLKEGETAHLELYLISDNVRPKYGGAKYLLEAVIEKRK